MRLRIAFVQIVRTSIIVRSSASGIPEIHRRLTTSRKIALTLRPQSFSVVYQTVDRRRQMRRTAERRYVGVSRSRRRLQAGIRWLTNENLLRFLVEATLYAKRRDWPHVARERPLWGQSLEPPLPPLPPRPPYTLSPPAPPAPAPGPWPSAPRLPGHHPQRFQMLGFSRSSWLSSALLVSGPWRRSPPSATPSAPLAPSLSPTRTRGD
jgi:hypothetical protein